MKRDMDLAREILLAIEANEKATGHGVIRIDMEGRTRDEISYHVKQLYQAGLIEAVDASSSSGLHWAPRCLTWSGHEFLDTAREPSRWAKAMQVAKDKGGVLSFDVLKIVLAELVKRAALGGMSGT